MATTARAGALLNGALLNGALIALGALAIVDNVVVHWLLAPHRAIPGPHALAVEIGLAALGAALLALGLWRERRPRAGLRLPWPVVLSAMARALHARGGARVFHTRRGAND